MSVQLQDGDPSNTVVERELEQDETLLWIGHPSPRRMAFLNLDIFIYALLWVGILANASVSYLENPFFPAAAPARLVLMFLMASSFPFLLAPLWSYFTARHTIYAITNRRILIINQMAIRQIRSHFDVETKNINRKDLRDQSGDLLIARRQLRDSEGVLATQEIKFIGIADVKSVEALVRHTFRKTASQPTDIQSDSHASNLDNPETNNS